jgi:hypothetical protein
MFDNTDIAIYGIVKKTLCTLLPVFKIGWFGIPIGSYMADITLLAIVYFIALSKIKKVKK